MDQVWEPLCTLIIIKWIGLEALNTSINNKMEAVRNEIFIGKESKKSQCAEWKSCNRKEYLFLVLDHQHTISDLFSFGKTKPFNLHYPKIAARQKTGILCIPITSSWTQWCINRQSWKELIIYKAKAKINHQMFPLMAPNQNKESPDIARKCKIDIDKNSLTYGSLILLPV